MTKTFQDCADCGLAARDRLCMSCKVRRGEAHFGLGAYGVLATEKRERHRRAVEAGEIPELAICARCGERPSEVGRLCPECTGEVVCEQAHNAWRDA